MTTHPYPDASASAPRDHDARPSGNLRQASVLLLAAMFLFVLGLLAWDGYRDYYLDDVRLSRLSSAHSAVAEAMALEDSLILTARVAADDDVAKVAYRRNQLRLRALLAQAAREFPEGASGIARIDAANLAMAAIHQRAFDLAMLGRLPDAVSVVTGERHLDQARAAIEGLASLDRQLGVASDVVLADIAADKKFDAVTSFATAALFLLGALYALRTNRHWQARLLAGSDLVLRQSRELEQANEDLEARVRERTGELEASTLAAQNLLEAAVHERQATTTAHEKLDYMAYYDALTGLANRSLFLERVAQFERSAAASGHKVALLLLDLERFRHFNDSLGRDAGDALLRQVAGWLTVTVGDASLLGHLGGDHFAVVLPEVTAESQAARLVESLVQTLAAHSFRLGEAQYRVTARFGVALYPDDGDGADQLFKRAEAALKKAQEGGERYLFYAQKMTDAVAGRLSLENDLRRALDNGEFVLHYQPKLNLRSGKVIGAEALIRWNDPRTGLVPPGRFIPVLEETGLIHEVGHWALRQAIADYRRWCDLGLAGVRVAVNVSPLQMRSRAFIAEIEAMVGGDGFAAAGLELEITEGMIMQDVEAGIAILGAVRALGITVAIDDFGTGFSSLGYLAKLPIDTVKIDRSFINELTLTAQGSTLVTTIINLAHALKLKVVAEGVETEQQRQLLFLLGCDEMQGFLFSKAVPTADFEDRFLVVREVEPAGVASR
jgi:diguanylate cyclase (GGDEF)-like protein